MWSGCRPGPCYLQASPYGVEAMLFCFAMVGTKNGKQSFCSIVRNRRKDRLFLLRCFHRSWWYAFHARAVRLNFIFGNPIDIVEIIKSVLFAGRIVFPKFDLGAQLRRLNSHAIFHPPGRDKHDGWKFLYYLQVGMKPDFRIEKIIQMTDSQVPRGCQWSLPSALHPEVSNGSPC